MDSPIIKKYKKEILQMHNDGVDPIAIRDFLRDIKKEKFNSDSALRRLKEFLSHEAPFVAKDKIVNTLHDDIKLLFKKKDVRTLDEISTHLNIGIGQVREALAEMKELGHTISVENNTAVSSSIIPKSDSRILDVAKMSTGFYKFGVLGDNHLGSKYSRLDVLNALYDIYEKEGIKDVYNTGNWVDGEARFNKYEILAHGIDGQLDYFIENYPQRKGITTHYITGDDHEGWWQAREGVDVGKYLLTRARAAGRTDLDYLGYMEADVLLKAPNGKTIMRVVHPGGGSSYATSYSVQKIVESYQGGEKPHILLVGHYHKADYTFARGVHIIQSACTMTASPFMRKKKLQAHLGGWIIEFSVDDNGAITRFKQEFIPFYDTDYYHDKWEYKH